jgi:Tfp pilus assembly protein FimT
MGVVMGIAIPGIQALLNTQKMKSATFDLVTTAMLARSEAIKWSGASSASISIVAPSNDFSNGWCIVFTSSTTCSTSAPGDGVMQIIKPTANITYAYQGTAAPIVFTRTGRLAGGVAVTLLLTDVDAFATPRCVTFDVNGNARVRVMPAGTTSCT